MSKPLDGNYFEVSKESFFRVRAYENLPRDIAIYLTRIHCRETLATSGSYFGIKNYSTLSSVVARVKDGWIQDTEKGVKSTFDFSRPDEPTVDQISKIGKICQDRLKLNPQYTGLLTIPGIGKTLALTIMLETGPIERFKKVKGTVKTAKSKATVAYAALSHKLARAAFYITRDNVEFDGKKLFV